MCQESSFPLLQCCKTSFLNSSFTFLFCYLTQEENSAEITESFQGVNVSNIGLALKFSGWAAKLFNWESQWQLNNLSACVSKQRSFTLSPIKNDACQDWSFHLKITHISNDTIGIFWYYSEIDTERDEVFCVGIFVILCFS